MGYIMKVCKGEDNERSIQNPSSSAMNRAIDDLIPAVYHFAILEANPPIEKCAYVQALIEREGRFSGQYLVEARYRFAGDIRHYRMHTKDVGEVKKLFQAFLQGTAPNVAGWSDITGQLIATAG